MYAIYGNIYHQHTPNVSIYTKHGSYVKWSRFWGDKRCQDTFWPTLRGQKTAPGLGVCNGLERWSLKVSHILWKPLGPTGPLMYFFWGVPAIQSAEIGVLGHFSGSVVGQRLETLRMQHAWRRRPEWHNFFMDFSSQCASSSYARVIPRTFTGHLSHRGHPTLQGGIIVPSRVTLSPLMIINIYSPLLTTINPHESPFLSVLGLWKPPTAATWPTTPPACPWNSNAWPAALHRGPSASWLCLPEMTGEFAGSVYHLEKVGGQKS